MCAIPFSTRTDISPHRWTGFEWATSNEFSHRNGFEIYGRNGVALSRHWQNGRTRTLHGIHTNGFPNFYCVQLAQSGVTINFPHALEEIVKHIAFTINECIKRNIRELEATEEAVDGYTKMCLEMAKGKTAFLESCTPGYYNSWVVVASMNSSGC